MAGVVPPCCSSVKVWSLLSWICPRITNGLSALRPGPRIVRVWSVVIDSAVRSFVPLGLCRSSAVCLSGPGESSTGVSHGLRSPRRARIARSDRRRRSLPRGARAAPDTAAEPPDRWPSEARRPSSRPSSASASTSIRRRGKFLEIDLDRDRIVVNPMLTGRFQLAAPGDEAAEEDGGRARASGRGRRPPAEAAAWTAGRRLAARGRRRGRGPLPRPDPDGQGLPAAGRGRPRGARVWADERAPKPTIRPSRSRSGASGSAGTRAN